MDSGSPLAKRFLRYIWLGLMLSILLWGIWSQPGYSQTKLDNGQLLEAPVVIDGREIFTVRGIENFTATKRASSINQRLRQAVNQSETLTVEVATEETGLVYLRTGSSENPLVTVTEADVIEPGYPLERQAQDWATTLQNAIHRAQEERNPDYVQRAVLFSLAVVAAAIAIHLLLSFINSRSRRYLARWSSGPLALWERPIKFFWQLGLFGLKIGLWLITFLEITNLFPQLRSWRYTLVYFITADSIVLGDQTYSALGLLLLLALTVGLWFAARFLAQLLRVYILKRAQVEPRLQDILSFFAQYILLFLGVIVLLQAFGINASSLTILASLLGVGIGFGVQNIANNFISGFIITLERPIQVGDFIKIGDLVGIVKRVGARSTEINTLDKVTIIVPNSRFLESEVINWSHGDSISRLRVPVSVAYGSDIPYVKATLLEAVKRHPEVLLRPEPEIWFQSFGDSALNFEIMVWTGDPRKQFRVKSDLNYAIEASLRHNGIEVPFVQQDVHLESPQLEKIITLLQQQPVTSPFLKTAIQPEIPAPPVETLVEQTSEQTPQLPDLLASLDVEALAEAMQGDQGIELQVSPDQSDGSQSCFTGAAAVDWLKQRRDYSHTGALLVGKWLLQKGLIYGLAEAKDFEYSLALYQFYQDSPAALTKSVESPSNPVLEEDNKDTEIYPFDAG
ncbi:MAG: mechanosensitive ion channel domain-containing protein [Cyanobacteria bacterium P01_D01_bin.156]